MRRMGALRVAIAAVALMGGTMASAEEAAAPQSDTGPVPDRRYVCMIDDSLQREPGIEYAYKGKTYYLCCQGCVNRFGGDPERYSHAVDPISGQSVDKAEALVYAHHGQAFFFANEAHRDAFAAQVTGSDDTVDP